MSEHRGSARVKLQGQMRRRRIRGCGRTEGDPSFESLAHLVLSLERRAHSTNPSRLKREVVPSPPQNAPATADRWVRIYILGALRGDDDE